MFRKWDICIEGYRVKVCFVNLIKSGNQYEHMVCRLLILLQPAQYDASVWRCS